MPCKYLHRTMQNAKIIIHSKFAVANKLIISTVQLASLFIYFYFHCASSNV